jgi:hypothetical protein
MKWSPLILGALLLSSNSVFSQSGWTKKKGEYFIKAFTSYGQSDTYFSLFKNELKTSQFTQVTAGFYGEYGLSDKLNLIVQGLAIRHHYFETTEKITGIADLPIGLKYQIVSGNVPVSGSLIVEVPIAKADNYALNTSDPTSRLNLPTGDGEWNVKLNLAASHSFYDHQFPLYLSLYGTFNYRTEYNNVNLSNQLQAGITAGVNIIKDKVWLQGGLLAQESFGDGSVTDFVRGEGTTYTAYLLECFTKLNDRLGASLTYFNYSDLVIDRANLYSAGVWTVGVTYELKK